MERKVKILGEEIACHSIETTILGGSIVVENLK